jgi:site-specific DNA-methyltransferase (adenine-specific)
MKIEHNKIYHMDAVTMLRSLADDSIDMILTSPPYDNLRTYTDGYTFDFETIAEQSYRVLKPGGVLVWVVGDATINGSETLTSMRQALYFVDDVGFKMHDTMIYSRPAVFPESNRYWQEFEYMFVLAKNIIKTFNPLKTKTLNSGAVRNTERQPSGKLKKPKTKRYLRKEKSLANIWAIPNSGGVGTKDKDYGKRNDCENGTSYGA